MTALVGWDARARSAPRWAQHGTERSGTERNGAVQQGGTAPHPRHRTALRTPLSVTSVLSPAVPGPRSGETLRPRWRARDGRAQPSVAVRDPAGPDAVGSGGGGKSGGAGAPGAGAQQGWGSGGWERWGWGSGGWERRAGGAPRSGAAPDSSPWLLPQEGLRTCPPRPDVPFPPAVRSEMLTAHSGVRRSCCIAPEPFRTVTSVHWCRQHAGVFIATPGMTFTRSC